VANTLLPKYERRQDQVQQMTRMVQERDYSKALIPTPAALISVTTRLTGKRAVPWGNMKTGLSATTVGTAGGEGMNE